VNSIARMLIDMAKFYNYDLDKRQLELYVDVLGKFDPEMVLRAGREYVTNLKNNKFPMPPHSIMAPYVRDADPRSLAIATVGRIKEAIARYGWPKPDQARDHIGEAGWQHIERCGGWQAICEKPELNIHEANVHAQMRDAIEADIKLGNAGFDLSRPAIEQSRPTITIHGNPTERVKNELSKLDFTKLLPKKEDPQ
jgi:hypothetical protein